MVPPRAVLALAPFLLLCLAPAASAAGAAPVATFSVDRTTGIPETGDGLGTVFRFPFGMTSDPDTPLSDLEFRWDWEGDGSWDTAWAPPAGALHAYSAPGTYSPVMEVRDPQGNMDSATGGPVLVEAPRPLSLGAAASGELVEVGHRHDYTLVVPESHLNLVIDLDWPSVAGDNLDLFVQAGPRPNPNDCNAGCWEARSLQTGGVERVCIRFAAPGTYSIAVVARSVGWAADVDYTLLARTGVVEPATASCLAAGQPPSAAFVSGLLP